MSRDYEELEQRGASDQEIIEFGTGRLRRAVVEGDVVYGSVMAGQVSGLVHEVIPAGELVRRTVAEAEAVLGRVRAMVASCSPTESGGRHRGPARAGIASQALGLATNGGHGARNEESRHHIPRPGMPIRGDGRRRGCRLP